MHNDEQGRDWNEGHPDHEGEMAVTQLHRLSEMADMLLDIIGPNDDLPGWIQYKLTRAYSDLNDVFGYMEAKAHEHDEGPQLPQDIAGGISLEKDGLEEAKKKKKKGLWANINAKKERGEEPAKPGDEGYPSKKSWDAATKESKNEADKLKRIVERLVANELRRK